MRSVFIRLVDVDEENRASGLRIERKAAGSTPRRRVVDTALLRSIPGAPFAYWVPASLAALFRQHSSLRDSGQLACSTNPLNADFRFARLGWEVFPRTVGSSWIAWAKGGAQSDFYADVATLLAWEPSTRTFHGFIGTTNRPLERPASSQHFLRPGITWPRRTSGLSMRALPKGCVFGDKGPALFTPGDGPDALLTLLSVVCSRPFKYLVGLQLARVELAQSFEVGLLQGTPVPQTPAVIAKELAEHAQEAWSLRRRLDTSVQVSHAFVVPAVLQVAAAGFAERCSAWSLRVAEVEGELVRVQSEIDELCFDLYGISDEDRLAIVGGLGVTDATGEDSSGGEVDDAGEGVVELLELDPAGLAAGLVSWAVGVAVGRFDVRLATGERGWPVEPDPFDQLPVCSPGMLTSDEGLPVAQAPAGYPLLVSPVLVDDPGHPLDVTGRVRTVFDEVFGVDADEWWSDVGAALGARDGEIGGWLRKGFFDYHLKAYSRSRRKAPVLWPIGTKSGSYLVWLYAHQVSADSLFQVLHDVVAPKLGVEERELTRLRQEAGVDPSLSQRKAIDVQEQLVGELRELREELEAVAPLWVPDLNDGIVIVLAPLWRLFAHHRPWSNELKKHWTKLAKGDYDWAHLAMHLWPERVIPKCAVDRSLAIAHNLEDTFWVKDLDNDDKWHSRAKPTTPIDQLIAEHHNPAVSAAIRRGTT